MGKLNIFVRPDEIDLKKYYIATYELQGHQNLHAAAWDLAMGQSIGNPSIRSVWETDDMLENHTCKIFGNERKMMNANSGIVQIAFPLANINLKEDGISQLLCQTAGGQVDIKEIEKCRLLDIDIPETTELAAFPLAKFGIGGVRKYTKVYDKPLLGGIVKPKVGMSPKVLLEITKELVDGGVNFIKEDEILGNPVHCPFEERVELISNWMYANAPNVIYSFCINSDYPYVIDRAQTVHDLGGNSIHVNVWNGLGIYKAIRELDLNLFIHFQKSGDKFFTYHEHQFSIAWPLICKIAGWSGADFIHAGMIGGYANQDEKELRDSLQILRDYGVVPALSCGMHPGLVENIRREIGNDWMANVGGAIHGHPQGTTAGAKAMRQAIDRQHGEEYIAAIEKWGIV